MVGGTPAHYENFPVASILLPPAMRPHIAAVYAFARTADDFADEGQLSPARRLDLLEGWRERLHDAARGDCAIRPPRSGEPADTESLFRQLAATIRLRVLPVELFDDLLSAFRQDVTVSRYATWPEVMDYCRRSANPVGRLVLGVAGVRDPETQRASDAVCTALQLANFWQDLGRDYRNGRIYVPAEEMARHGASETELAAASMSPAWRATVRACVERTHTLFASGRTVADRVRGRLRWELRATWHGGVRILEKIAGQDYDTLHRRPTLTRADVPIIALKALTGFD